MKRLFKFQFYLVRLMAEMDISVDDAVNKFQFYLVRLMGNSFPTCSIDQPDFNST